MFNRSVYEIAASVLLAVCLVEPPGITDNLVTDSSFEKPKEKDRFGRVFAHWDGWIYDGACEFRVSSIARTSKT